MIIYNSPDGEVKIDVLLQNENVWLSQDKIAELFGIDRSVATKHIANIFTDGEMDKDATCAKIAQVQKEGSRTVERQKEFYSLDCILAVGYRTNSHRAIMLRKWATKILKEYIIKGSVLDDERLKIPNRIFGQDYFDETLARIKDKILT
jgi:hypothetical protein